MADVDKSDVGKAGAIIASLFAALIKGLKTLVLFIAIVLLGILVGIVYAIPWLLRAIAILLWFYGGYLLIMAVETIYAPFTPEVPVMVLQFFVVAVQLFTFLTILMLNPRLIWSALYFTGITPLWLALSGIPASFINWEHADFFYRVLPPTLYMLLLIFITIRGKLFKAGKWKTSSFTKRLPGLVDTIFDKADAIISPSPPEDGDAGEKAENEVAK